MMHFEEKDRETFANLIVDKVGLTGTDQGKVFITSFKGLQNIYGSITWRDKVIDWIKNNYSARQEVKNLVKANNPAKVLSYIEQNIPHF